MGKFYGSIGYAATGETRSGIHEESITERKYFGDVLRQSRRLQSTDNLNDNIVVSNVISVIADPFAYDHYFSIRYVEWMGVKWKATNVEVSPLDSILL